MDKRVKVKLSINLKNQKINTLKEKLLKYITEDKYYDVASDLCDIIYYQKKQIDELCDLLIITDEEKFNQEYDFLSKYLEVE